MQKFIIIVLVFVLQTVPFTMMPGAVHAVRGPAYKEFNLDMWHWGSFYFTEIKA